MPDIIIKCKDCAAEFTLPENEQIWLKEKGYVAPKRCKPCRAKRKNAQAGAPAR